MSELPNFNELPQAVQSNPYIQNIYTGGVEVDLDKDIGSTKKEKSSRPQLSAKDKQKVMMYAAILILSVGFAVKNIVPASMNPFRKKITAEQRQEIEDRFAEMQFDLGGGTDAGVGRLSVEDQLKMNIESAVQKNSGPPGPGQIQNNSKVRPDPGAPGMSH